MTNFIKRNLIIKQKLKQYIDKKYVWWIFLANIFYKDNNYGCDYIRFVTCQSASWKFGRVDQVFRYLFYI